MMSNKYYDLGQKIIRLVLPALVTLWLALDQIWHFQFATQIAGTLTAITTFLGVLLEVASKKFSDASEAIESGKQGSITAQSASKDK